MQAAPRPRARRLHALRFHPAQRRQHGGARVAGHEPLLDEHDGVGLVEGVQRLQHGARATRRQLLELGQHPLAQSDAGGAEAAILR